MTDGDRENLKKWALAIVNEVEPDNAFALESGIQPVARPDDAKMFVRTCDARFRGVLRFDAA